MPIVKRSLTLKGHRTSVSLETEFWDAFRECAAARSLSLNALASEIDAARLQDGQAGDNLSAAIRLYVLAELQDRLKKAEIL